MTIEPSKTDFTSLATGSVLGFPAHGGRPGALGEVHSRPHPLIEVPRIVIQLSFMTEGGSGVDLAFVRLLPNAASDPSFGNLGRRTIDLDLTDPGVQVVGGLVRDRSRLLFSGLMLVAPNTVDVFVGALESDTLFAYGME